MTDPLNPMIPVSTDPLVGVVDDDMVDAVPAEIDDFIAENGIADHKYTCYVKQYPPEGGGTPQSLPWNHNSKYPTAQELGENFGPGKYLIMFSWRSKDRDGKNQKHTKEYKMILGPQYEEIAMEKAAERMIASKKRLENMATKEQMRSALNGNHPNDRPRDSSGIDGLKQSLGMLRDLGVPIGGNNQPAQGENMGMVFQMVIGMMQKSSDNTMAMMMENSKQNNAMMIAMMQNNNNNKPQTHDNAFQEVTSLMHNMLDMKSILSPEKKSSLDKFYDMMQGIIPGLIAMTAEKRKEMGNTAKMFPGVPEIGQDEQQLKYMVEKLDKAHGPEQTDTILESLGWTRPAGMHFAQDVENKTADELRDEALNKDNADNGINEHLEEEE